MQIVQGYVDGAGKEAEQQHPLQSALSAAGQRYMFHGSTLILC